MNNDKIYVPPIKIQGIKTKIVPYIKENVIVNDSTIWVEPFMGSGAVGFNIQPKKAIFCDINPYYATLLGEFSKYIRERRMGIFNFQIRIFYENKRNFFITGNACCVILCLVLKMAIWPTARDFFVRQGVLTQEYSVYFKANQRSLAENTRLLGMLSFLKQGLIRFIL